MARAPDVDLPGEPLRHKYLELTRKYAHLVSRLEKRTLRDFAIHRPGRFGLRSTGAGLALIRGGQVQVSNSRFLQLSRSLRGPLVPVEGGEEPQYADLRSLVLTNAQGLLRTRAPGVELRYRDTRSKSLLVLRLERNPSAGDPLVLVVVEDVTEHERREQELARTREALLYRERLRVMGELAASIAHDLGNTLRGASFQLASLKGAPRSRSRWEETIPAVSKRIEVASEVILRLHDFAQTGILPASAVRLDRIVAQAAALVEFDFRAAPRPLGIELFLPELPAVRASAAELSLLFVNLLRNARDAMPRGGTVTVTAHRSKGRVAISVADRGVGISRDVQRRLFEPFFTTKGPLGTGLGLWLAQGTMSRLGGTILAANRRGGGAVFVLTFPLHGAGVSRRSGPSGRRPASAPRVRSGPAPRRRKPSPRAGRR